MTAYLFDRSKWRRKWCIHNARKLCWLMQIGDHVSHWNKGPLALNESERESVKGKANIISHTNRCKMLITPLYPIYDSPITFIGMHQVNFHKLRDFCLNPVIMRNLWDAYPNMVGVNEWTGSFNMVHWCNSFKHPFESLAPYMGIIHGTFTGFKQNPINSRKFMGWMPIRVRGRGGGGLWLDRVFQYNTPVLSIRNTFSEQFIHIFRYLTWI